MIADSCDVVVVGSGAVGATAALLLASHGLRCIVVEQRREPSSCPAAQMISSRTMQIWREIDVARDVAALSVSLHHMDGVSVCTTVGRPELGRIALVDPPHTPVNVDGPPDSMGAVALPPDILEPLLWLNLRDNPRIDLRSGWKYLSHSEFADGVAVSVADTHTGTTDVIVGDYVLAADGSCSSVRRALQVAMTGPTLQHTVTVHFAAELDTIVGDRHGSVMRTHTSMGPGTLLAHRAPDEWQFEFPYFPPVESLNDFPADACRARIIDALGDPTILVDVKSVQLQSTCAKVAASYRTGRTFLAGDAAHSIPHTSGLGLNTGIADVHNLAWKLVWVATGRAGATLLDTYELERQPIGDALAAEAVEHFDGLLAVAAALGMSPRAARLLPRVIGALPTWMAREPVQKVLRGLTGLAYRRSSSAESPGSLGIRTRRRLNAAIATHSEHRRACADYGAARYQHGVMIGDYASRMGDASHLATQSGRAGGPLPHGWLAGHPEGVSTLDLLSRRRLTLLMRLQNHKKWLAAAQGLPLTPVVLTDCEQAVFATDSTGQCPDALVVRPDGHIVAELHSDRYGVAALQQALRAVGATSQPERYDAKHPVKPLRCYCDKTAERKWWCDGPECTATERNC